MLSTFILMKPYEIILTKDYKDVPILFKRKSSNNNRSISGRQQHRYLRITIIRKIIESV